MRNDLDTTLPALKAALADYPGLAFAVLIGSRANGRASEASDWDIAVQWQTVPDDPFEYFGRNETLRRVLAKALEVSEARLDIVDLHRAGLTMRIAVVEEGIPLQGDDGLPWARFLTRTWRDMEHWMLEQRYAP